MANFSNITGGLNITAQIPLDVKTFCINEATLSNLGVNNNLAYTYYDGLKVYCFNEKTTYIWKEVTTGQENTGLLSSDFIYPANVIVFGVDYSIKKYNFYREILITADNISSYTTTGPAGATGPTGPTGPTGATGTAGTNGLNGLNGTNGLNGAPGVFVNLQTTIYSNITLNNTDHNQYSIMVDCDSSPSGTIDITVPSGLANKFCCGFTQISSGQVNFIAELGGIVVIQNPTGLSIKGMHYATCLEQIEDSDVFQLTGDTKL